ncbi:MAG: family 2 glycosyl transferase [Candidatus Saccharibacteria bacterium]|nr:family 2 glycosyl transferase [Candidatus Saccharibacteria bacterium]
MNRSPEVAVQYVNYKTITYLQKSLADVLADAERSKLNYHVYVIDNASGDNLDELRQDHVTIIESAENIGFGAGHNRLAQLHDSQYTLLLNPDTRVIQHVTVERLIQSLELAEGAAVIGPRLVSLDHTQQAWDHGELDPSSGTYSPKSAWEPRSTKGEVAWTSGAAMLLRTATFKSIGGFDEKFFLYKEEEDLSLRLRQAGFTTYYDPAITVLHIGSVVATKELPYFDQSIKYYNQKHGL